jgi:diguanylate cyclase (GGDEF)-like protein
VGKRPGSNTGRRKLASLRLQIARAEALLSALRAAIEEARSDAGLAAVQGVRAENKHLLATNLLATQAACATQAALDVAVKASQTDPLTGLRNRSVLWDRLSHELDLACRLGQHVGVFVLDLDDFKKLNDLRGHAVGDLVLQRVASVLSATVRASDTVCRLGGDEFVVVASTVSKDDVDQLAQKIGETLREPFSLAGQTTTVSVSLGFSVFPDDGNAAEALVNKADEAMYRVKQSRSELTSR